MKTVREKDVSVNVITDMATAKAKSKQFVVIENPELLEAVKAFVPVFGNEIDRNISNHLVSFRKKLKTVDNKIMRSGKNLTEKMKDILFEERGLIHSIINRNMDF